MEQMTFDYFQDINKRRCQEKFHTTVDDWPIQNWLLAISGEVGEACNLVKKTMRGDFTLDSVREEVLHELADIICYCDLAITCMGARTEDTVKNKFNIVSNRVRFMEIIK